MTRRVVYLVTTALAFVAFAGSGVANLLRLEHVASDMVQLGYPAYFMTILGTWKILGAIAIAVPRTARLEEWAYAGMIFDLTGAAVSRAVSGHGLVTVAIPLVIAAIVVASYIARPSTRALAADARQPTRCAR